MEKSTAFKRVLEQADALGQDFYQRYRDRYCFPLPGTGAYQDAVSYAILLYLSKWMRWSKPGQSTIYRYAKEHYLNDVNEKRYMYAHERALLKGSDDFVEKEPRYYDSADFHMFTNHMKGLDPLFTYAVRKTLPFSKSVNNITFAAAYKKYDEEYERAAGISDSVEYTSVLVHLFRKEYGFAFSIIAQIAQYMKENKIKKFDFAFGKNFWTNILVEDLQAKEMVLAPPDIIRYHSYIPMLFEKTVPEEVRFHYLRSDIAARTLYSNIYNHLDFPVQEHCPFDFEEVAEYLRRCCPIIENHRAVSFYDDEIPDKTKISLTRKIMKQSYKIDVI